MREVAVTESLNLDLETNITKHDLTKEAGTVKSENYAMNLLEKRPETRQYSKIQPKMSSSGRTPQTRNSSRRRHIKDIIDRSTQEPSFLQDKKFMRKHLASRYQVKLPSGAPKSMRQEQELPLSRNSKSSGNNQEWMNQVLDSQKRSMAFENTSTSLEGDFRSTLRANVISSQRPSVGTSKEFMFSQLGKMKTMLDSASKNSDY
mmetsp:Transcript_8698/g.13484  ORF Transcript_8698/g.13484 Transcript_8698/m.13484 type:complete len:204 (+) Transcript_8698:541-1152(+)|eukprot:CAMPEP_0170513122 /NCGR_PEP_ID=MMETSP0208-20121228/67226_1 /TAXON_ID=197538 /ORGANISM="Strombidium inclinatum, Strain S3" /LENGTH=203 /DNA_ID=CAMNT_0010796821 /DNA_START=987 /DNA_END=1598 /DNA_ORIENTATION=-